MDLVLRNARLIDGSGRPSTTGDLGILNGRIAAMGKMDERAKEEIDVRGAVVAPGFIDVHTHYDAQAFWDPLLTPSIYHGVTSVIAGNCGFTLAPLSGDPEDTDYLIRMLSRVEGMPLAALRQAVKPDWRSFGEFLGKLDGKLALNTAFMVGHSALRRTAMGARAVSEAATADDLEKMKVLLRHSLAEGGMGFSTTVSATHSDYEGKPVPSRWADRDEILALCRVVNEFPGTWLEMVFGVPVFSEREYSLATDMSLAAGRALNWNLLTISGASTVETDSQLQAGDYAKARGARVYALVTAGVPKAILSFMSGFLMDTIPGWMDVIILPPKQRIAALADPQVRAKLRQGLDEAPPKSIGQRLRNPEPYQIEGVNLPKNMRWVGKTVGEYAAFAGKPAFDALLDLAVEEELRMSFSINVPENRTDTAWQRRVAAWRDDRCIIGGSDAGAHLDMLDTFAFSTQFIGGGVRERQLLPLEEAVHRITGLPAERFGLTGRGRLEVGACADIVVFDPDKIGCGPVAMRPDLPAGESRLYADAYGVSDVIVNGVPVVRNGEATGKLGGRVLRSGRDTQTVPLS
ncbi:MAG: aminoacylase [Rhodospirillaceae bacterium]|nr:MAG: aminoacylase [Rhodospirillaceae bacterium]